MKQLHRTSEQIQELLREFTSSGLTQREFAQRHRVCTGTVQYWLRHHPQPPPRPERPRLIEVETFSPPGISTPCRIELPGGVSVSYPQRPEPQYLAELVRQLRSL